MRIKIVSTDSEDPEVYGSLEELEAELDFSADPEYRAEVLKRIAGGETRFTMGNGDDRDTYYVTP